MPAEKQAPIPQLSSTGLKQLEFVSRQWAAEADANTKLEHLLAPEYWAHHAAMLAPWDEIKVRSKDGTWYAHLLVLDVSRTWAKTELLHFYPLTTKDVALTQASNLEVQAAAAKYEVKHRGPRKWSVLRISDGAVMAEDLGVKEDAEKKAAEIAEAEVRGPGVVTTS